MSYENRLKINKSKTINMTGEIDTVIPADIDKKKDLNFIEGDGVGANSMTDLESNDSGEEEENYSENVNNIDKSTSSGTRIKPFNPGDQWKPGTLGVLVQEGVNVFIFSGLVQSLTIILGPLGRNVPIARLTSSIKLMMLPHVFSVFFGMLVDAFPIMGYSWKPYLVIGWIIWLAFSLPIAIKGDGIETNTLIFLVMFSQIGWQLVHTADGGFLPWITSREKPDKKGYFQTQKDIVNSVVTIISLSILFLMFNGPQYACYGYEADPTVPCTTDEGIMGIPSVAALSLEHPDNWCHMQCPEALLQFSAGVGMLYWMQIGVAFFGIAFIFPLYESKKVAKSVMTRIRSMWEALKCRAVYQITFYTLVFGMVMNVENPGYAYFQTTLISSSPAWVFASVFISTIVVTVALLVVNRFLGFSWHRLIIVGIILDVILELIRLLSVFDVGFTRNPIFFMFLMVPQGFLALLTSLPMHYAINIIAEPGLEAATVALIDTTVATAAFVAIGGITMPLLGFFPLLGDRDTVATDTNEVRMQFLMYDMIAILLKLSTIFMLPLLPRQRKEAAALRDKKEKSTFWAVVSAVSVVIFLSYSVLTTCLPFLMPSLSCRRLLGGTGCTEDESVVPSILALITLLGFCYIIPFAISYWPIINRKEKFSWNMFLL